MNKDILKKTVIFHGMSDEEIDTAVSTLTSFRKKYKKGDFILEAGSITEYLGVVMSGSVTIENNDVWGNRTILSHVGCGQFFAETYSILKDQPMLVDVTANEDCEVFFLRTGALRKLISDRKSWTVKLLANILSISAHKNLALSERNFHISPKTIRGRIISYLNAVSIRKGSRDFEIPFDRQQLADYLNVDRTALSKELGKMRDDGMIEFRKNHFRIITDEYS